MRSLVTRTGAFSSFVIGCLALATAVWGQRPLSLDDGPDLSARLNGRTAVPEPQYYVAAEPRQSSEPKSQAAGDGEKAFQDNCTTCHDAQRSLSKRKTLAAWRVTVQMMAKKPDADIPEDVREPIAKFLSVRAGAPDGSGAESGEKAAGRSAAKDLEKGTETDKSKDQTPKFDPAVVQQGTTAFNASCTTCHSADKALNVTKSLAAWRSTVERMAAKDGANIPENTHEPIAVYLASLGAGKQGAAGGGEDAASSFTVNGTIAPSYRYSGNQNLEYPGHFGDAWLTFGWQSKGPVTARVTTCISCHSSGLQLGSIELVEAAVRFDVSKAVCPDPKCPPVINMNVEAGRFVVPFGAYYQEVNPGVDRAVTKPLIYSMGERVEPNSIGDPVLPMPYSDEGSSINLSAPVACDLHATFNAYMVNGLEGNNTGIDFFESRDYVDNNRWPAVGGRATIGGEHLRLGCSVMGGRFNPDTGAGPMNEGLDYLLFGGDVVYRWKDIFRFQFEYAQRNSDRFGTLPNAAQSTVFGERVSGYYFEAELLVWKEKHVSIFGRYDSLFHDSPLPVLGSVVPTGNFGVNRYTYGVNWTLPGGSLLMVNHEIWDMPQPLGTANVLGVRWAATF